MSTYEPDLGTPWGAFETEIMELIAERGEDALAKAGVDGEELTPQARALAMAIGPVIMQHARALLTNLLADDAILLTANRARTERGQSNKVTAGTAKAFSGACQRLVDDIAELPDAEGNPHVEVALRDLIEHTWETGRELHLADPLLGVKRKLATG